MVTLRSVVVAVALMACMLSAPAWAVEEGAAAPAFKLMDQFGKTWELSALRDSVVVLVAANRESGRAMGPWVEKLKQAYGKRIQLLGLIQLNGIPGFARGMARSRIRKETSDPIAIDFAGPTGRAYGVSSKYPVVVVVGKTGAVQGMQRTGYTDDAFKYIATAVDKCLVK